MPYIPIISNKKLMKEKYPFLNDDQLDLLTKVNMRSYFDKYLESRKYFRVMRMSGDFINDILHIRMIGTHGSDKDVKGLQSLLGKTFRLFVIAYKKDNRIVKHNQKTWLIK